MKAKAKERPTTWRSAQLVEVCDIILGQSPPGSTYNTAGIGLPFFQGKAEFGNYYPTPVKWCSAPTKIAEPDDVLISVRAPVGPTNLCPSRACIGRGLAAIRTRQGMPARYLLYALRATVSALMEKSTGSTFEAINGHDIRSHVIPIPQIDEQQRIVAEIEKQFTRLEAGVAALKRVQANLKRYRAAILKTACEGRLVPTEAYLARQEGRPYETGDQLLARIPGERRGKYKEPSHLDTTNLPPLPEGWTCARIDQMAADTLIGLDRGRAQQNADPTSGFPYIKMSNVTMDGTVVYEHLVYVPATAKETSRFDVQNGDILFNTRNSKELVGKVGLVRTPPTGTIYNNNLMRIRLAEGVSPTFLVFQMCSKEFRQRMELIKKSTTNVAAVYAKDLFPLVIALPPLAEQERIVAEVERRLSVIEEQEAAVSASLRRATRLRQSILQRAFSGGLVYNGT